MRRSGRGIGAPIIQKEAPHMFMWFYDGRKIPKGASILPENLEFNHLLRLEEECQKLEVTGTPVYLIYMGRLLNSMQQAQIQDLAITKPNLFVVDYDKIETHLDNSEDNLRIKAKIAQLSMAYQVSGERKALQPLIELARLVLIYNSQIIGEVVKASDWPQSDQGKLNLDDLSKGIIARDFDVVLGQDMPDIKVKSGYYTALSLKEDMQFEYTPLEREYGNGRVGDSAIIESLSDIQKFTGYIELFSKPLQEVSTLEMKEMRDVNLALRRVQWNRSSDDINFKSMFLGDVFEVKNSLIAVSDDKNPNVKASIKAYLEGVAFIEIMRKHFMYDNQRRVEMLQESLGFESGLFKVGAHRSFQMSASSLYTQAEFGAIYVKEDSLGLGDFVVESADRQLVDSVEPAQAAEDKGYLSRKELLSVKKRLFPKLRLQGDSSEHADAISPLDIKEVFSWKFAEEHESRAKHIRCSIDCGVVSLEWVGTSDPSISNYDLVATQDMDRLIDQLRPFLIDEAVIKEDRYPEDEKYCDKLSFAFEDLQQDKVSDLPLLHNTYALFDNHAMVIDNAAKKLLEVIKDIDQVALDLNSDLKGNVRIPILSEPPFEVWWNEVANEMLLRPKGNELVRSDHLMEGVVLEIANSIKKHELFQGYFYEKIPGVKKPRVRKELLSSRNNNVLFPTLLINEIRLANGSAGVYEDYRSDLDVIPQLGEIDEVEARGKEDIGLPTTNTSYKRTAKGKVAPSVKFGDMYVARSSSKEVGPYREEHIYDFAAKDRANVEQPLEDYFANQGQRSPADTKIRISDKAKKATRKRGYHTPGARYWAHDVIGNMIAENLANAVEYTRERFLDAEGVLVNESFLQRVIEFAQVNGKVSNANESDWIDYAQSEISKRSLGQTYLNEATLKQEFKVAKSLSVQYQKASKESGIFTGREDGDDEGVKLRTKDKDGNEITIGARMSRIPEPMNQDLIKATFSILEEGRYK